jgi:predicted AAA+ superfamily ATPase
MKENIQINRNIENRLPSSDERSLILITGARQTGNTTLLKKIYKRLPYYDPDAIEYR